MRELELYIHISFCVKKCEYCDFLSAPANPAVRQSYIDRLVEEICSLAPDYRQYQVTSIFIGGGTPSILDLLQIARLMGAVSGAFHICSDAEVTMECNPGTLTGDKARALYRLGINRLSLGLQSVKEKELLLLGRIHSYEDFLKSYDAARKAGFSNINVDLMSALPCQTVKSWEDTLRQVAMLRPEHISAYSLIIEEGTPFYLRFHEDEMTRDRGEQPLFLPSEEDERRMYELTEEFLSARGYRRYEISNYAKPGFECRHNIGYWTGKEYLGLGLGASSLIDNIRFQNTNEMNVYMRRPFARLEEEVLDRKEQIEEFMILGLRMTDGVRRQEFSERFGVEPEAVYGSVFQELEEEGLLEVTNGRIVLTKRGVDVSNVVFMDLLL
ncbi:MAG: radical SAM family heme chaperone HemW [Lachnospiraceae bacterium]|nr:radical SAM family heme chaperone HemW [Lachnospiraceae bacterium]